MLTQPQRHVRTETTFGASGVSTLAKTGKRCVLYPHPPVIPADAPRLSTFTMTCFATLPTRYVLEQRKFISHRIPSCPRRTNGESSFPKPVPVPVLHTASSHLLPEAENSIFLVRSLHSEALHVVDGDRDQAANFRPCIKTAFITIAIFGFLISRHIPGKE